jgi:hypothetical protein
VPQYIGLSARACLAPYPSFLLFLWFFFLMQDHSGTIGYFSCLDLKAGGLLVRDIQ